MAVRALFMRPYRENASLASVLWRMTLRARWAAASRRMHLPESYSSRLKRPRAEESAMTSLKAITPAHARPGSANNPYSWLRKMEMRCCSSKKPPRLNELADSPQSYSSRLKRPRAEESAMPALKAITPAHARPGSVTNHTAGCCKWR